MKRLLAAALLATLPITLSAMGAIRCDCTIVPFKPEPPCVSRCSAQILGRATFQQLVDIIEIAQPVARKIVEIEGRHRFKSLDDYAPYLSGSEIRHVRAKVSALTQRDLDRLRG